MVRSSNQFLAHIASLIKTYCIQACKVVFQRNGLTIIFPSLLLAASNVRYMPDTCLMNEESCDVHHGNEEKMASPSISGHKWLLGSPSSLLQPRFLISTEDSFLQQFLCQLQPMEVCNQKEIFP
uniref:Uncharacterized protein n=1 Tax=Opuntia streptacantha TaxID=393608 RepID=A0A7C9EI81_OPUST